MDGRQKGKQHEEVKMREAKIKIRYKDEQYELITAILHTLEEASEQYDAISDQIRIVKGAEPLWKADDEKA